MPRLLSLLLALILVAGPAAAQEYVSARGGEGRLALASEGRSAPLHVAAGEQEGVVRAARDLTARRPASTACP